VFDGHAKQAHSGDSRMEYDKIVQRSAPGVHNMINDRNKSLNVYIFRNWRISDVICGVIGRIKIRLLHFSLLYRAANC
jgi:hypothetical protein